MATKKQLAALAKARAARKKKTATTRKKTVRKTASTHYVLCQTVRGKRYCFTGKNLDTEESKARTYANKHIADAAVEMAAALGKKFTAVKK